MLDLIYTSHRNEECCVVQRNGRWYRAYCLEVCFDGFVTFQFIDYGNIQLIEVNDIRPIPTALLFDCFTITADCLSDYGNKIYFDFDKHVFIFDSIVQA